MVSSSAGSFLSSSAFSRLFLLKVPSPCRVSVFLHILIVMSGEFAPALLRRDSSESARSLFSRKKRRPRSDARNALEPSPRPQHALLQDPHPHRHGSFPSPSSPRFSRFPPTPLQGDSDIASSSSCCRSFPSCCFCSQRQDTRGGRPSITDSLPSSPESFPLTQTHPREGEEEEEERESSFCLCSCSCCSLDVKGRGERERRGRDWRDKDMSTEVHAFVSWIASIAVLSFCFVWAVLPHKYFHRLSITYLLDP